MEKGHILSLYLSMRSKNTSGISPESECINGNTEAQVYYL